MSPSEPPEDLPIEQALLERFLFGHPEGGLAEFDAWAPEQAELLDDADLRARVRSSIQRWLRAKELLSAGLDRGPGSKASPASDFSSEVLKRLSTRLPTASRYKLKGEVARGGMGAILRVWDEDLRRHLAMKVILGKGGETSKDDTPHVPASLLARFLEEAQVTGQLDHPGIVPVHELGLDSDGQVYFTMKLVKGKTLKEVFEELEKGEGGRTQTRVLGMLLKVCEAMAYAHDKQVVHRDLKPANVMVGKFGEVYVMDWGLAKILGREEDKDLRALKSVTESSEELSSDRRDRARNSSDALLYTVDGTALGTPYYMPPEQAEGRLDEIGPPADVYALGAMLYQLLTGRMPYHKPGERAPAQAILARVLKGSPKPVSELAPDAPPELVSICEKAMARETSSRYANMSEMADDLSAYIEGRVVRAYETGAWAEARKWIQRNKALSAAMLLAVAGLGATAFVQAKGKATERELRGIAEENERVATERADDVFRLSLSQDYSDLLSEADKLWPPHPNKIDALDNWISAAESLCDALPALVTKRDELRAEALELTEAEHQADREAHSEYAALVRIHGEISAARNALAVRRGQEQPQTVEVNWKEYADNAEALNSLAWPLVDPGRETFGQEALGLALALRAQSLAQDSQNTTIRKSIAWGRFALGDDERALEAAFTAYDQAPEEESQVAGETLAVLEEAVDEATSDAGQAAAEAALVELESKALELEALVGERRTWTFPKEQAGVTKTRWWHKQLTELVEELESLSDPDLGLLAANGISAERGWSVSKRLAFAERLRDGFATGGEFALRWDQALPAIHKAYPGLELSMQMGLVPIGADPASNLWEFWDIQSGAEPVRAANGKLVLEETSGLVFVLLPGGKFWMGSQSGDPAGQNFDRDANIDEGPVHEVELTAFLMSKYEMTQGQWRGLTGWNRSLYTPSSWSAYWSRGGAGGDLLHPVTNVTWVDCHRLAARWKLTLPSEAQWEYGARGGTSSVYWSGSEVEDLQGVANVADSYAKDNGGRPNWNFEEELDDGYTVLAPVDALLPNAFGLHNVHGNVWEWCLDGYEDRFYVVSPPHDPVSPPSGFTNRVPRGGGFSNAAIYSRAADRQNLTTSVADSGIGFRPVRVISK